MQWSRQNNRAQGQRAKRQDWQQGEGFEMNPEGRMPSPSEYPHEEWRRGGRERKQADSKLGSKAVCPLREETSKGQALGWGTDDPGVEVFVGRNPPGPILRAVKARTLLAPPI